MEWNSYLTRYVGGEWRAPIFRDMVLVDAQRISKKETCVLDIGCGGGFDNDTEIQRSISAVASQYIGIEPDMDIKLNNFFTSVYPCPFEDAAIKADSVDIAFAVMVLEHVENPQLFWDKVYDILCPGGIFWGFTMDARHFFRIFSILTEKLHIKNFYLNTLRGERGEQRYENYGTYYKMNSPKQIEALTDKFSHKTYLNFNKIGQMDYYFPKKLRWIGRTLDNINLMLGLPGSIFAVRVEK